MLLSSRTCFDLKIPVRGLIAGLVFIAAAFPAGAGGPRRAGEALQILWTVDSFGQGDFFHEPSDIAVDGRRGRIYIADSRNNRVVVFDLEGRFVSTIGRQGQGPGEFSRPTGLYVRSDGGLAVADYGNDRIQFFDPAGKLERTVICKDARVADLIMAGDLMVTIPAFGESGYSMIMDSGETRQPLAAVMDLDGRILRTIGTPRFSETQPFVRAILHRVCLALSPEGRLYFPHFALNLIQVYDLQGNMIGEFDRPMPFKPITPRLEMQRSPEAGVVQMAASLDFVSRAAEFGSDGLLYILTCGDSLFEQARKIKKPEDRPPLPMRIEVIDPESRKLVRTLDCGPGARVFALIEGGRLVVISETEEGEIALSCLSMPRN